MHDKRKRHSHIKKKIKKSKKKRRKSTHTATRSRSSKFSAARTFDQQDTRIDWYVNDVVVYVCVCVCIQEKRPELEILQICLRCELKLQPTYWQHKLLSTFITAT